jgi:hypothetical protein
MRSLLRHSTSGRRNTSTSCLVQRLAAASLLATTAIIAACSSGSDSSTGPSKPPTAGAYPMATARGMTVPHTFTDAAGSKLTIQGGALTMSSNGTFTLNYKGKLNALTFDLTDEGKFSQSGSVITFTPDDGDPAYTGRLQGKSVLVSSFKIAGARFDLGFATK